jgi:hypothetical protein
LEGKNVGFDIFYGIENSKVITSLETSDKCMNDQSPTFQKVGATNKTIERRPNTFEEVVK